MFEQQNPSTELDHLFHILNEAMIALDTTKTELSIALSNHITLKDSNTLNTPTKDDQWELSILPEKERIAAADLNDEMGILIKHVNLTIKNIRNNIANETKLDIIQAIKTSPSS